MFDPGTTPHAALPVDDKGSVHLTAPFNVLYQEGFCAWPLCSMSCASTADFKEHLATAHDPSKLMDEVVFQIEFMLLFEERKTAEEKQILYAMLLHFDLVPSPDFFVKNEVLPTVSFNLGTESSKSRTAMSANPGVEQQKQPLPSAFVPTTEKTEGTVFESLDIANLPSDTPAVLADASIPDTVSTPSAKRSPAPTVSPNSGTVSSHAPTTKSVDEPQQRQARTFDFSRLATTFSFPVNKSHPEAMNVDPEDDDHRSQSTFAVSPPSATESSAALQSGQEQVLGDFASNSTSAQKRNRMFLRSQSVAPQYAIIGQDLSSEIERGVYQQNDMQPPYTYPMLIPQAIIRSPNKELGCKEILQWFEETFKFFRTSDPTWRKRVHSALGHHKNFKKKDQKIGSPWHIVDKESAERGSQVAFGFHERNESQHRTQQAETMEVDAGGCCSVVTQNELATLLSEIENGFYQQCVDRPNYELADLIHAAFLCSSNKGLTTDEMIEWFKDTFTYFRKNNSNWESNVRFILATRECFLKENRRKDCPWTMSGGEKVVEHPQHNLAPSEIVLRSTSVFRRSVSPRRAIRALTAPPSRHGTVKMPLKRIGKKWKKR